MTVEQATTLVTNLICRARSLDASQVSGDTNLADDLSFDSLDAAELLAALHKETGLQLDIDSLQGMQTIGDIARGLAGIPDAEKVS